MGKLRDRMEADLRLRNLRPSTQDKYLRYEQDEQTRFSVWKNVPGALAGGIGTGTRGASAATDGGNSGPAQPRRRRVPDACGGGVSWEAQHLGRRAGVRPGRLEVELILRRGAGWRHRFAAAGRWAVQGGCRFSR